MVSVQLSHFHGGLVLKHHKKNSCEKPALSAGIPDYLFIALPTNKGKYSKPIVKIGDQILKGQILAIPEHPLGTYYHAPTSGVVTDISVAYSAHPNANQDRCITIKPDGNDQWIEKESIGPTTTPKEIIDAIRKAGIVGLGGAGFPTHIKYQHSAKTNTLIINGAECEPYISCDERLMLDHPSEIIKGTQWLMQAAQASQSIIAIEDNIGGVKSQLDEVIELHQINNIQVVKVPTIYPTGGEKQLIKVLTGQEVKSGQTPLSMGLVMQNVATAKAVYDALEMGKPLIERLVTVTGESVAEPRNFLTLIGTPFKHLLDLAQLSDDIDKLVVGGPMMGFAMPNTDIGVEKTTNCLLALPESCTKPEIKAMPCIRCGDCVSVCPQELLPQQLLWYINGNELQNDLEKAREHHVFDCIECGACSWVCPSHINLVDFYRFAKSELTYLDLKKSKAEHAKQRHDDRAARLERIKAERQAKRRKKTSKLINKDSAKKEISAVLERIKQQNKGPVDD